MLLQSNAEWHDANRFASGPHEEGAQLLILAEVPPIGFQPFKRLKERGVWRLGEPGRPEEPVGAEGFDIVDLLDFDHRADKSARR